MKLFDALRSERGKAEKELGKLRQAIEEKKDELRYHETALPPKAEIIQTLHQRLDTLLEHDRASMLRTIATNPKTLFSYTDFSSDHKIDLLLLLLSDQIKAGIEREVSAMSYEAGSSLGERQQLIREVQGELKQLERQEEQLITAAQEAGIELERRPVHELDPAVLLVVQE